MSIPEILEIVPWSGPPAANITVPGSKSITNRALILAALAQGETRLQNALWSDDTQVMVAGLQRLGYVIDVEADPAEAGNRHLRVVGQGGFVPAGGTRETPTEIFVGLAGTAARFLAAMLCLGTGVYRLHGGTPMHARPQGGLFAALRQLGYAVESEAGNDHLPALIYGDGPHDGARASVGTRESSQFASALILAARVGGWTIDADEDGPSPYVEMTRQQADGFSVQGGSLVIEPSRCAVQDIVDPVIEQLRTLSSKKGLAFDVVQEADMVFADKVRARQILFNLIGNAIKFTDTGFVRLVVKPVGDVVSFEVHDSGAGIPEAELQSIFEVFYQVDSTATRRAGGTGMGLAISRSLAEMQGGSLSVSSVVGQGSCFILTLPIRAAQSLEVNAAA